MVFSQEQLEKLSKVGFTPNRNTNLSLTYTVDINNFYITLIGYNGQFILEKFDFYDDGDGFFQENLVNSWGFDTIEEMIEFLKD